MFSWRYWSHIRDSQCIRRIFRICRATSFPKFSMLVIFHILICPTIIMPTTHFVFVVFFEIIWRVQSWNDWVWESWTRQKMRTSWKWRLFKFFQSELEKLLVQSEAEKSMELLCHSFINIYIKHAPPPTQTPQKNSKSGVFQGFSRIFCRIPSCRSHFFLPVMKTQTRQCWISGLPKDTLGILITPSTSSARKKKRFPIENLETREKRDLGSGGFWGGILIVNAMCHRCGEQEGDPLHRYSMRKKSKAFWELDFWDLPIANLWRNKYFGPCGPPGHP